MPESRVGASPINMLTIVPRNAASIGGRIFPDIDAMGDPVFETDERIIWHDSLRISVLRQRANDRPLAVIWESPVPASVWLTDRRLVFSCKKFTSGDWKVAWMDWGELLVSTVNSVSAEIHRFGKMAIGQIRHEWPIGIFLKRLKPRIGRQLTLMGVTCIDPWDDAQVRLNLGSTSETVMTELAQAAVQAAAAHRLVRAVSPEAVEVLKQQAERPTAGDHRSLDAFSAVRPGESITFPLPGATKIS